MCAYPHVRSTLGRAAGLSPASRCVSLVRSDSASEPGAPRELSLSLRRPAILQHNESRSLPNLRHESGFRCFALILRGPASGLLLCSADACCSVAGSNGQISFEWAKSNSKDVPGSFLCPAGRHNGSNSHAFVSGRFKFIQCYADSLARASMREKKKAETCRAQSFNRPFERKMTR